MSTKVTKVMLEAYKQDIRPTMFLSGMFQAPRRNFHNSEEVEIDIQRSDEDVAVAIQDLSVGARLNSFDGYTNKSFKPPVFKEAAPINAHTLIGRMPGDDPFMAVDFQANALRRGIEVGVKCQNKIARATELQASQVLTTGTVTLVDDAGSAVYTIDYAPKTTHFPTAGTAWSDANSTKLADIEALADVIRADGLYEPDMLVMGTGSYELFIDDSAVQARFDNRNMNNGRIVNAERMGNGGKFRGFIEIGDYTFEIWTYDGRYSHPQTGVSTKFIADDKVIVKASAGRMDATFGGIPRISNRPDPRVPAGLTQRVTIPEAMFDVQMNAWVTPDDETMFVQAGSRPLMIPTAIDTYGCLDTGI